MDDGRISWTWRHAILKSNLKSPTRHVLLTLSCFMNDVGGGCYPTTKKIAVATGLSERSVCTHLDIAHKGGWINRKRHGFAGQKWANYEYEPSFPEKKPAEGGSARNCEGAESNDRRLLKEVQSKVPLKVPEEEPPIVPHDRFDEFWGAYPKKVSKAAARKIWKRLMKAKTDPGEIIDGARRYAAVKVGEDRAFIKNPDGWLNGERWLDNAEHLKPPEKPGAALREFKAAIARAEANGQSDFTGSGQNRDRENDIADHGRVPESRSSAGISNTDRERLVRQIGYVPGLADDGDGDPGS